MLALVSSGGLSGVRRRAGPTPASSRAPTAGTPQRAAARAPAAAPTRAGRRRTAARAAATRATVTNSSATTTAATTSGGRAAGKAGAAAHAPVAPAEQAVCLASRVLKADWKRKDGDLITGMGPCSMGNGVYHEVLP